MDGKEREDPGIGWGAQVSALLPGQECQRKLGGAPPSAQGHEAADKCSSCEWCARVWYGCSTAAVVLDLVCFTQNRFNNKIFSSLLCLKL